MKTQRRVTRQAATGLILALAATVSLAIVLAQAGRPAVSPPGAPASATAPAPIVATVPPASASALPTPLRGGLPTITSVGITPIPTLSSTETFLATEAARRQALATTAEYIASTIGTATPAPTGIVNGPSTGFSTLEYSLTNSWYGVLNGHPIAVFAGAFADDPEQGMVHIMEWLDHTVENQYLTPIKAGSLRIVAEQNLRLTLQSANGTIFYFDVPGRRFVASLGQAVLTATPFAWPTGTPTPVPPTAAPVPTCTPGPTPAHASGEADCLAAAR